MNTKLIAGLMVAGIIVVGGIFAFAGRSSDDPSNSTVGPNEASQQSDDLTTNEGAFPSQLTLGGQPYVATIETVDSDDSTNNANIKLIYDSAMLWSADVMSGEGNIKTIYTGDASYIQSQSGDWTKFPVNSNNTVSIEGYTFSDSNVNDFRTHATYLGKESCSLGMCDVWEVANNQDGTNGKMWIGSDLRLVRAILSEGTTTTEVTYDYDADTSVTLPKKFKEINIPSEGEIDLEALESLIPQ